MSFLPNLTNRLWIKRKYLSSFVIQKVNRIYTASSLFYEEALLKFFNKTHRFLEHLKDTNNDNLYTHKVAYYDDNLLKLVC